MRATRFRIEGGPTFSGFSDDSTWNGWANPYFTLIVAQEVLDYYQDQDCEESREQWLGWDLRPSKVHNGLDLCYFGGGYLWEEVTQ